MKKIYFFLALSMITSGIYAQKNVIVEELTGTWCHWCPGGIYYGDSLTETFDNVYFIAIHTNDIMENVAYVNGCALTGAPSANIGRRFADLPTSSWFAKAQDEMQITPKAAVDVSYDFDPQTRELNTTITATALENMEGNYRFAAIVVEDGITGTTHQYNQSNAYSGGALGPMGGWENLPNPVLAERMAYNHVGRELLGGYDGEENSFPSSLALGQTATHEFAYTLPLDYDENYVRIVGLLIADDGSIENAGRSTYLNGSDNATPLYSSSPKTESFVELNYLYNVYFHDPDNMELSITANQLPEWLTLEQYDNHSASLSGIPTQQGDYEVSLVVSDGTNTKTQAFTINVHEALGGSWEYVGERAFRPENCVPLDMTLDNEGTCYILAQENDLAVVYKNAFNTDTWESIGNINSNIVNSGAGIAVTNNGEIYIGFTESAQTSAALVKKWDGSAWSEVGNIPAAIEIQLCLDSQDIPYFVCRNADQNYGSFIYKLENGQWNAVGGGTYANGAMWASMTFDNNDTPYVVYANGSMNPCMSKYENGAWSVVGNGTIGDDYAYYYLCLSIDDNNMPYVAFNNYTTRAIDTYRFNGTSWESIGEGISNGSATYMDIGFCDNDLLIAYVDGSQSNFMSVIGYDVTDEEWNYIGQSGCSEGAISYPKLSCFNATPYVAFCEEDLNSAMSCMRYVEVQILYPPTDFTATVFGNDNVELSWNLPIQGTPSSYNIYRNDDLLANVTENSYNDLNLSSGTHRYTLTAVYEEGESVEVGPISVETTLGVAECQKTHFSCLPSITEGIIYCSSDSEGHISVFSANGTIVIQGPISSGESNIDLSRFPNGMYFIRFTSGDKSYTAKVVKQ